MSLPETGRPSSATPAGDASMPPQRAGDARTRHRLEVLQAITALLSRATGLDEVAAAVVRHAAEAVRADAAILLEVVAGAFQVVASVNMSDEVLAQWRSFALDAPLPAGDAVRRQHPVLLTSRADRDARYPSLRPAPMERQSWAVLPLVTDVGAVGVVSFGWPEPDAFDVETVGWLQAIADQCAVALDRARLYEAERAAHRRQAVLAEASRVLGSSLDYVATLRRMAPLVLPELADAAAVHVLDAHGLALVEVAHVEPDQEQLMRKLSARQAGYTRSPRMLEVVRTGRPLLMPVVPPEAMTAAAESDAHAAMLAGLRVHSALVVPLLAQQRCLGTLTMLTSTSRRTYGHPDVELAEDLAARAAAALSNAQAHRRLAEMVQTLQHSLLPPALPVIDGLEVAARYRPLGDGAEVGGDFYDVVALGQRRIVAALGDVAGKGVAAASLTALARHTIRAAARHHPDPAAVLRELNEAMLAADAGEGFVTVAVLVADVDPTTNSAAVRLALGGHPPPLHLRGDGVVEPVGEPGTAIGLFADIDVTERDLMLRPGEALVLYSDGALEARSADRAFADDLIAARLARLTGRPAGVVAAQLESSVVDFEDRARDDIAILVLRIPG